MIRRDFLKTAGAGMVGTALLSSARSEMFAGPPAPHAVWVENGEPDRLLAAAFKEFGGVSRFIARGDVVVIKPNIGWDEPPEHASNTNPDLVASLVRSCLDAGAKTVKVFDRTCNNPLRCYTNSGVEEKAKASGADVLHVRDTGFVRKAVGGELVKDWPIFREYLDADKTINVPIAKHHSLSRVTLGMKNLMGVMGGNRGEIHNDFTRKITDIDRAILPTLTIVDGYRILTKGGPRNKNLENVQTKRTLVMSPCMITADYVALDLFGLGLDDVDHLSHAVEQGLARYDVRSLNLQKVKLAA
jgi:uncharacterized protein (DUF362 family)